MAVMTSAPMTLSANPERAMVLVLTMPVPNTMAFGAVATGNIKAQLADKAAGTMSAAGSMPAARPAAANTGISNVVVAVLDVTSVKNVTAKQMVMVMKTTGQAVMPKSFASQLPMDVESPDASKPRAMAMPPPKRMSKPHGISEAVAQSSMRPPFPFGIKNSATTAASATVLSPAPGRFNQALHPPNGVVRVTHAKAVSKNTTNTRRSAADQAPKVGS